MTQEAKAAACIIQTRYPDFKPKIGIILGSGLSHLNKIAQEIASINYEELPGFPKIAVEGHQGQLSLGYLADTPVVFLKGRKHPYEGSQSAQAIKTYVRTLKLLGCEILLATNAAGSLNPTYPVGSLVLVNDHINLQLTNPLIGENEEEFGPRFPALDNAYDPKLRHQLLESAEKNQIILHQGVYLAVIGPNYETAAEIRAMKILGADLVGMSTVPEIIVARHCGLRCAVISTVTNLATGLNDIAHDHKDVVKMAAKASESLSRLISTFITECR